MAVIANRYKIGPKYWGVIYAPLVSALIFGVGVAGGEAGGRLTVPQFEIIAEISLVIGVPLTVAYYWIDSKYIPTQVDIRDDEVRALLIWGSGAQARSHVWTIRFSQIIIVRAAWYASWISARNAVGFHPTGAFPLPGQGGTMQVNRAIAAAVKDQWLAWQKIETRVPSDGSEPSRDGMT